MTACDSLPRLESHTWTVCADGRWSQTEGGVCGQCWVAGVLHMHQTVCWWYDDTSSLGGDVPGDGFVQFRLICNVHEEEHAICLWLELRISHTGYVLGQGSA